ncbi:TatD family hydrolase [Burkholderiales bacterium]|nr:TatD family hydrolase [Burkholderiales bacterium]
MASNEIKYLMQIVDSHCHINFPELVEDIDGLLTRMRENNVVKALCVSVQLEKFQEILDLSIKYPHVYASVGVHPDNKHCEEPTVEKLVSLSNHAKVVAIGETGLDYFRSEGDTEWQRNRFRVHIDASKQTGKPLIIHTREAGDDTLEILREQGRGQVNGVMHCFTETLPFALASIELGFLISFSGILTFKNAEDIRAVAKAIPIESIMIETDSPYLAPTPNRGKTNEPSYVRFVLDELARVKGLPIDVVAQKTTENFHRLFLKNVDESA